MKFRITEYKYVIKLFELNLDIEGMAEKAQAFQPTDLDEHDSDKAELTEINEKLGQVTSKIDDTGKAFSDSAPLQNIEKSITGIKGDISKIDIRIGVVSNTLLQLKLKERTKQIEDGKPIDILDNNEYELEAT